MARHDPHGKEDLGERFSQFASVCGITDGHDLRSANDTPALNALKALRGAPISMGRGEIPVRLAATSRLFCLRIYSQKSVSEQERTFESALSLIHIIPITAYFMEGGVAYDRS